MRVNSVNDLPEAMRKQAADALANGSKIVASPPEAKRDKFGSQWVEFMGIWFQSKWECQRYQELLQLERVDQIQDLHVQVPFGLHVRTPAGETVRIASWTADFQYWREDKMIIEDAKSGPTRKKEAYVLRRAHFEAEYGLWVHEVERFKPRFGVSP